MLWTDGWSTHYTFLYNLLQKKNLNATFPYLWLENILLFLLVLQGPAATHGAEPVPGASRDGPGPRISPPPSWELVPHKCSCPKIPMHSSSAIHGHSFDSRQWSWDSPALYPSHLLSLHSTFLFHLSLSLQTSSPLSCCSLFRNTFWKAVSRCKTKNLLSGLIFLLTRFPVVCRLCLMSSFQFKCSYSKIRKTIPWLAFLLSVLISFLINS